ncbi:MAG: hypothetical protein IAI48_00665 [Candidatus Eremiobacteraeota bacterium]|nr:hypothetical protein [Candidatus Eremiobacteraeota bacterium]
MNNFCDKCGAESIGAAESRLRSLLRVTIGMTKLVREIAPRLQHIQGWGLNNYIRRLERTAVAAYDARIARHAMLATEQPEADEDNIDLGSSDDVDRLVAQLRRDAQRNEEIAASIRARYATR